MQSASRKKTGLAPSFKYWVALAALAVAVLGALLLIERPALRVEPVAIINGQTVQLEVANTPAARTQGLSGREMLAPNKGLLLVFEEPGYHGIWMRDMLIPLDIIWIADGAVVDLETRVTPESYPEVFRPQVPASYVLEVNAGFAAEHAIEIGSLVEFAGLE